MTSDPIHKVATHNISHAIAGIAIAVYLVLVLSQGNMVALGAALKQDLLGGNGEPGLWRWLLAVIILYALAQNEKTNFLFGPLFVITLFAMLINVVEKQPKAWQSLNDGIAAIFNFGSTGGTANG